MFMLWAKALVVQSLVFIALVVDNRDHIHKSCHRRKMQIHPIVFKERHQQCWDLSTKTEYELQAQIFARRLFLQWEEIWRGSLFFFFSSSSSFLLHLFFFFCLILDVYVRSDNHCAIGKGSAHHFALAAIGLWPVLLANLVADMFTALNFSPFIQGMRLHIRRNTAYAMTNSILPLP